MPKPDPKKIAAFATPKEFRKWLRANHARENELWVKVFKLRILVAVSQVSRIGSTKDHANFRQTRRVSN